MRVALCYNKKPESDFHTQKESDENDEPPPYHILERYAEFDDDHTIQAIAKVIEKKHEVYLIEADEYAYTQFLDIRPDLVFNIAEGLRGSFREAFIPSILEHLQIPYTGSDPLTLSICLDKALTKQLLKYHKISTPEFLLVSSLNEISYAVNSWRHYPCIVKPVHEGSSIGIKNNSLAENSEQLSSNLKKTIIRYKQPVIIEHFLFGREFTVGILGNNNNIEILPLIEICFDDLPKDANPIYSYEAKWIWDTPGKPLNIFKCPPQIDKTLYNDIKSVAFATYTTLRCRDWARIDLRLNVDGIPNVLEVNPLPGILPDPEDNSCMPKAAKVAGLEYDDLILKVLDLACERYGIITKDREILAVKNRLPQFIG